MRGLQIQACAALFSKALCSLSSSPLSKEEVRTRLSLIMLASLNYELLQEEIQSLDNQAIDTYNSKKKADSKFLLRKEIKPCPFEGDIEQARVVMLLANPSFSPNRNNGQPFSHENDHTRNSNQIGWGIFSLHEDSNPAMRNWWQGNLSQLQRDTGLSWQVLSNRIAALQINAWASEQFDESCKLESLEIMRSIALEFSKRDVIFVACRRYMQWTNILDGKQILKLNSYRRAYITRNNLSKCDGAYDKILQKLLR